MKKILQLSMTVIIATILSSCGGGDIDDLKQTPVYQDEDSENYEFVNTKGEDSEFGEFSMASVFQDGLALVKEKYKSTSNNSPMYGYINDKGEVIIDFNYVEATDFSEGIAWVVEKEGVPMAIDTKGEVLFTLNNAQSVRNFHNDLAAYSITKLKEEDGYTYEIEQWGFINNKGETVLEPKFFAVGNFKEGLCVAKEKRDDDYGYINDQGKLEIKYQFATAGSFKNGKAVVRNENKEPGVINKKGEFIIKTTDDYYSISIDGNMFLVNDDDYEAGWLDKKGEEIIRPQFDAAYHFNDNKITPAKDDDKWGYIDDNGEWAIEPIFDRAFPFNNDIAVVRDGSKYGFINKKGDYEVNPIFHKISDQYLMYISNGSTSKTSVTTQKPKEEVEE